VSCCAARGICLIAILLRNRTISHNILAASRLGQLSEDRLGTSPDVRATCAAHRPGIGLAFQRELGYRGRSCILDSGQGGPAMSASAAQIHPTAIVSAEAVLAEDVIVGPFVIIEGRVRIGPGCVLHPRAHLIGPVTMGVANEVFSNAIIGGRPQHFHYKDEPTSVEIGDHNVFRENVTVHRGTTANWTTRIGSGNFFMAGAHVAHDCKIGNKCIIANNALIGGHCILDDNVYVSGNAAIHQFCRLGRLSFLSGTSGTTKDIPPFIIQQCINHVVGVNLIGMRRAGLDSTQINAIRRLYHIVYLQKLSMPNALARIESELGHVDAVREWVQFVHDSKRGINGTVDEAPPRLEIAA
jgi:UDP-N-acetylglucosamine acyltransferase